MNSLSFLSALNKNVMFSLKLSHCRQSFSEDPMTNLKKTNNPPRPIDYDDGGDGYGDDTVNLT